MRLLIVTLSAGQGHLSVASALAEAGRGAGMHVEVVDVAQVKRTGIFRSAPMGFRQMSSRSLRLYDTGWDLLERAYADRLGQSLVAAPAVSAIASVIAASQASHVLTVAPFYLAEAVARACRRLPTPPVTGIVVTDYSTPHRSWLPNAPASVFAPSVEAASRLAAFAGGPITNVSGVPIRRRFMTPSSRRIAGRTLLGVDPDRFTVLVWGGGLGTGGIPRTIATIPEHVLESGQLIVVAGRNTRLLKPSANRARAQTYLPFVDDVLPLIDAADVVVGKPGSSALTETAARKRWAVYTSSVGRQEEGNAGYGAQRGWGVEARSDVDVTNAVRTAYEIWSGGDRLFAASASDVGDAGSEIISRFVGQCSPCRELDLPA